MSFLKVLGLSIFLASCGVPVEVSGSADLNVNIKVDAIEQYFRAYCEEEFPFDLTEQDQCVNVEVAKFLKVLTEQE